MLWQSFLGGSNCPRIANIQLNSNRINSLSGYFSGDRINSILAILTVTGRIVTAFVFTPGVFCVFFYIRDVSFVCLYVHHIQLSCGIKSILTYLEPDRI